MATKAIKIETHPGNVRQLWRRIIVCVALFATLMMSSTLIGAEITCISNVTPKTSNFHDDVDQVFSKIFEEMQKSNKWIKRQRDWLAYQKATAAAFKRGDLCLGVLIRGRLLSGDDVAFATFLATRPLVEKIYLISPGGNLAVGMAIGREIRRRFLVTEAPRRLWKDQKASFLSGETVCRKGEDCICASSCFIAWAGGIERQGNMLGLHRPTYDEAWFGALSPAAATQKYAELMSATERYLAGMEVNSRVIDKMLGTQKESIIFLADEEDGKGDTALESPASIKEWFKANCETLTADEEADDEAPLARQETFPKAYREYLRSKEQGARHCSELHALAARLDASGYGPK